MILSEVQFPVYLLGKQEPIQEENLSYYLYHDTKSEEDVLRIIDNKSIGKNTLSSRRLILQSEGQNLYPLRYCIFLLQDLIKLTRGNTWYIDSAGKIFSYRKTARVPLTFHRVKALIPGNSGLLVEVEGVVGRFKILYAPNHPAIYAGILRMGKTNLLYGLYSTKYSDTTRMI